jgi:hypothetical protein
MENAQVLGVLNIALDEIKAADLRTWIAIIHFDKPHMYGIIN